FSIVFSLTGSRLPAKDLLYAGDDLPRRLHRRSQETANNASEQPHVAGVCDVPADETLEEGEGEQGYDRQERSRDRELPSQGCDDPKSQQHEERPVWDRAYDAGFHERVK